MVVLVLLFGCTTWILPKCLEKQRDGNYTRILRAVFNESWEQHPTKQQLQRNLLTILQTIQVRRGRHAGHSWRSKDEHLSDVLFRVPTNGRTRIDRAARTYPFHFCADPGFSLKDLPGAMEDDRDGWGESVSELCYQHYLMMINTVIHSNILYSICMDLCYITFVWTEGISLLNSSS